MVTPRSRHAWLLSLLAVGAAAGVARLPPLVQDPAYHRFADGRPLLGVANAWNVLSNVPFLVVGVAGLRRCARQRDAARASWCVAFTGVALVAAGSAWYHLDPSAASLVWDRLPMTIGFMGVATAVVGPAIGGRAADALLGPAVAAGVASVGWWHATGDLRPYVWVQFTPLLLIAAVAVLRRSDPATRPLVAALALYAVAKALEAADAAVLAATDGVVAGHALKHLAAGAACAALVRVAEAPGVRSR